MIEKLNPLRSQGADLVSGGVRYRTWAPGKNEVSVVVRRQSTKKEHLLSLAHETDGYFSVLDPEGAAGDLYQYRFDDREWPDPASRFNPMGVHGPGQVIDPANFVWPELGWSPPNLSDLVIYELHIGTFTPEGSFIAAIDKLRHIAELGATAIEIMPVADFPGQRNWGYDGVLLYAPARVYGTPDDLRALIAAAHAQGLAVILDVVYNHLGPDGNYLGSYSRDYFNSSSKTPWGDAFNVELEPVREFFLQNAEYWRREFRVDGFRLDATHAIADSSPRHFLAELSDRLHSLGAFVLAEDERNEVQLLKPTAQGGMGLDGIWSDDFHHVVRVMLTGVREGYYRPYLGNTEELAATLDHGWLFEGPERARKLRHDSSEAESISPQQFIFCISNHDQIGNQAFGMRLNQAVSPAAYRAASALLCFAPYTPLLLMGQEWAASSPFQFFTDHEPDLGRKITEGRWGEFKDFAAFRDPVARAKIPDPQAEETFLRSKLSWNEITQEPHAGVLRLYREGFSLRHQLPALRERERDNWEVLESRNDGVILLFGKITGEQCLLVVSLTGEHQSSAPSEREWKLLFSSNDRRFGGTNSAAPGEPEVRLLHRIT